MKRELRLLLISLLGFQAACESDTSTMYGTPRADFTVSGTVTDAEGAPIPGIEVTPENGNSTLTDADGRYDVTGFCFPRSGKVLFKDTDGEENGGLFKDHELGIEFTEEERTRKGGGGWDCGAYAREEVDVVLEKAAEEPEEE